MASIFSRIVSGEIPCYKIAETGKFLAFLDAFPLVKGHTLVVPKQEIDYIFDVEDTLLAEMMVFAKKVAKAVDAAIDCKRVGVAVLGLEVPHCHIHLCPMNSAADINFENPKITVPANEMQEIAEKIKAELK